MLNPPFLLIIMTIALSIAACTSVSKKEITTMAFPKHPRTIKMITMLDKSEKEIPISEIPESNHFVYYDSKNSITSKGNAVKSVPIVEIRMSSIKDGKLVQKKEATYLYLEMYSPSGERIKTHTLWRDGIRGGRRKTK